MRAQNLRSSRVFLLNTRATHGSRYGHYGGGGGGGGSSYSGSGRSSSQYRFANKRLCSFLQPVLTNCDSGHRGGGGAGGGGGARESYATPSQVRASAAAMAGLGAGGYNHVASRYSGGAGNRAKYGEYRAAGGGYGGRPPPFR